jgi:NADP-dependent 3-hydroxy acid dehydrogenase YdfG
MHTWFITGVSSGFGNEITKQILAQGHRLIATARNRKIRISSYGGQVASSAKSLYHATKLGIEGFCELVAQEVAQFGIGLTIFEPGGARMEFHNFKL